MKLLCLLFSFSIFAQNQWSENYELKNNGKWALENRENPFNLSEQNFNDYNHQGKIHASSYPYDQTELLFPYKIFEKAFNERQVYNPVMKYLYWLARKSSGYKTKEKFFQGIGMYTYPKNKKDNYSHMPHTKETKMGLPLGASLIEQNKAQGLTFGCASCHSGNLFGKKVIGMTTRFPRGNSMFVDARKMSRFYDPIIGKVTFGLNKAEEKMLTGTLKNLKWVRAKDPMALGLDTSLSQVGASLHYRAKDEFASKIDQGDLEKHPLEVKAADSKPAVWWNLKYKTRWLSDASLRSGNPIFTNFIWNEIGRGVDLKNLESWFENNEKTIQELTTTVFASKAPKFLDFFDESDLDLQSAKRGEKIYKISCQRCHGVYIKNWSLNEEMSFKELVQTKEVRYHKKTIVKDVGTDPLRYQGMKYFYKDLNRLSISKKNKIIVEPQKGYVPPPLVGIWARWPYFHNNSAPTLMDVISPVSSRPKKYYATEADDKNKDFDKTLVGYPRFTELDKRKNKDKYHLFDTSKEGMSNTGHDRGILVDSKGKELLSTQDKLDLIEFLKTL